MRAIYELNEERMKQLLSFEPGYKKNLSNISTEELLKDFTEMFLYRLGMTLISETKEDIKETPIIDNSVQEIPSETDINETPIETSEKSREEIKEEIIETEPEEPPVDDRIDWTLLQNKLREFGNNRELKVDVDPISLDTDIICKSVTLKVSLTGEEFDKYYDRKKQDRREGDYAGVNALIELLKEQINKNPDAVMNFVKDVYMIVEE